MISAQSLVLVTAFLVSSLAFAGNPPRKECINVGNTIQIKADNRFTGEPASVNILVSKYDSQGRPVDQYKSFKPAELTMVESEKLVLASEKRGCTSREVYSVKYTFSQVNGTAMPDAYNRLAETDGTLNDYFLCTITNAWLPTPGSPCK